MEELIGQSLDRYRIVSLLGEGGMGAVFKGYDVTLQREVAIKVMHPHIARRPDFQDRFLQEARTAAQLDHPGIVAVYDFGQALSHLYIVMEFIPGANLRTLLADLKGEGKWIVLPEGAELVRQVSLAVDYAHRHGVLHRDLKPENIMLKTEESDSLPYRPVLTDLGLAKLVEGGLVTAAGTSMGTPAYMSPEQAEGKETDARSDVYSLGILMYELAVGQLPFPARTITEAIRYHTQERPPEPRSVRPEVPEPLQDVILHALEKDPADRFQNSRAFADALATVHQEIAREAVMPTLLEGAADLSSQLRKSVMQSGEGIPTPTPAGATELREDHVAAECPGGVRKAAPIGPNGMTIGRAPDNNLVLDFKQVSDHHARITYDGNMFQVTDLNSESGTYLENVRLLPGVSEEWTVDKPLRIGEVILRLKRRREQVSGELYRPDGTLAEPSSIRTSAGEGRVAVFVEAPELSVDPGSRATLKIVVLNQGSVVDHFTVRLTGVPAEWVSAPPLVRLMPGVQQGVEVVVHPPRSPQSKSGRYPSTVMVASQDDPHQVASVEVAIAVSPYSQFASSLKPQRIKAGRNAQVVVENQGNSQQIFNLRWEDRADELNFRPPQTRLTVPEGRVAAAEFRASPRKRRWFGGKQTHAFTAEVASAAGETRALTGEVISRGLIPRWVITLFLVAVLAAGALAAWYISSEIQSTTSAQQTVDAAVGATLTYDSSMAGAATATAAWLAEDDDRDGVTNKDELEVYFTLPDKRDTDEDGLDDGAELAWGTDPLQPDSDQDGIKDGREIENGWNPNSPDTDGDGTPDAIDPDPGQMPTLTPTPIPSATATPTPTPTITPTPWLKLMLPTLSIYIIPTP